MWILISWLLQKPADLDLHCLQEKPADQDPYCLQELIYFWFHTVFERINCFSTVRFKLICSFGQIKFKISKIFYGQVRFGFLLVPGQVENFTFSTPLVTSIETLSLLNKINKRGVHIAHQECDQRHSISGKLWQTI